MLFGWLHRPAGGAQADIGMVICKPFGYDAICSHRSLRAFAEAGAAIGLPVLRFDYAGTGDSGDIDPAADQIAQWTADILAAAETLRRECRVKRVCLLGLRLGALLAAVSAADSDLVSAVATVAPVVNGRRYLRELRTFQATAIRNARTAGQGERLEVTGFNLSAASVESLGRLDLMDLPLPPAREMLILDRSDLPGARLWAEVLVGLGGNVQYESLPGFPEMMSTPHATHVPQRMIDAAAAWLKGLPQRSGARGPLDAIAAAAAPPGGAKRQPEAGPILDVPMPSAAMDFVGGSGAQLSERALYVDEQRTLFAILTVAKTARTTPGMERPSGARRGVILLNAGATNHIGPNRMYVSLARCWAQRGYVVLRLDLAGLGDSATRAGQPDNLVYPPDAMGDIASAIEFLRSHHGVETVTLAGLCAGAYHALRAAAAGLPVHLALMINPLTFFWKQGMTLNDLQIAEIVRNPGVYRERVLSGAAWGKLLCGRVNLRRVAMVFARRAILAVEMALRGLSRRMHVRLPRDLAWDLQTIASRGVRMVFVFARGDTGADLLRIQGGTAVETIGDRCRVYTIDGADHIFSQSEPRAQLEQLLGGELPA